MTEVSAQSCKQLDYFRKMAIKETVQSWHKELDLKNRIQLVPVNIIVKGKN